MSLPPYLTVRQTALLLGKSVGSIHHYINNDPNWQEGMYFRRGKLYMIRSKKLQQFYNLEEQLCPHCGKQIGVDCDG